jgi:DegV family protein with EDD domain
VAQHVAVVTDSSACLPPALAQEWGVTVIPLQVTIDGEARAEGTPGLAQDVVNAAHEGRPASTSQPNLDACAQAFTTAARDADVIVAVGLSEKMSGTVGAMRRAAQDASVPVAVVDSRTVSLGLGFAALSAAAAARLGADADAVAREAERVARSALVLFTVDTLAHLRKGGRVSPAVAAVGSALNIRPLLGVVQGEVVVAERVRTSAKCRQELIDRLASRAPALRSPGIGIVTLQGDDDFDSQARAALSRRGHWPILSAELSAVLGAHTGPGTLGGVVADIHPDVAIALATT